MRKILIAVLIFDIAASLPAAQVEEEVLKKDGYLARVQVVAFEARGMFLGAPTVRLFQSQDEGDRSRQFHEGTADGIPFGVYKLEAHVNGFYPETRYVAVYRPNVTVVVGLPFGREAPALPVPPSVHGRVIGILPRDRKTFAKLTGIYSNRSFESSISADGQFDFSVPWDGRYLLLVVSEDGVLGTRVIDVPYSGSTINIEIGAH